METNFLQLYVEIFSYSGRLMMITLQIKEITISSVPEQYGHLRTSNDVMSGYPHLVSDKQYGFRFAGSTANVLTEFLYQVQDDGEDRVLAVDISKAFDRVWWPSTQAPRLLCHRTNIGFNSIIPIKP